MRTSTLYIALAPLLSLASASPIIKKALTRSPEFQVVGFTFYRDEHSSHYQLNLAFPDDVSVSNSPASDPVYVVPGFTDSVTCSGTYVFDAGEDAPRITPENTCARPSNPRKSVRTEMDIATGELFLFYTLNGTSTRGPEQLFTYAGSQQNLSPVDATSPINFTTPATSGPGIDS